jgi:hypothetical protein
MKKKELNRALKISMLFASILLVFTSFKSSMSSLGLSIPKVAGAASSSSTGAGKCREAQCPGEGSSPPPSPPPPTCKPAAGQMVWPKTGKCVPQNCQKSGFTMVRNATGNCVPSTAPCEDVGAKRDAKGNCVPRIVTEKRSKQGRTGGNNGGNRSTDGGSGTGIQGGSGSSNGVTQQGVLTGGSGTIGTRIGGDRSTQQGSSSGGNLILDSEKAKGSKMLVSAEPVTNSLNTTETEGGSQQQQQQSPPDDSTAIPKGANLSTLGSGVEQSSMDKESATESVENNNSTNLGRAKQQYLSAWNMTEFRSGFDAFIEPGSAKGYGVYKEINSQTLLMPGKTIELYVEPVGFGYKPIIDKKGDILYEINFTVNALIFDKQGNQAGAISYDIPVITSYNKNTEQYLTIPIRQEETPLPGGDYIIRYFITDGSNGETFELAKNLNISQIVVSA